jgi:HSP20 family protein
MSIIKWEPFFRDLEKYFFDEDLVPLFPTLKISEIAADIWEDEKNVYVDLALPGINIENVDIEVEDNILKVSGKAEEKKEEKKENYYRKEIRRGAFQKVLHLPAKVSEEGASATYKDGILHITLPKEKKEKVKKIKIQKK